MLWLVGIIIFLPVIAIWYMNITFNIHGTCMPVLLLWPQLLLMANHTSHILKVCLHDHFQGLHGLFLPSHKFWDVSACSYGIYVHANPWYLFISVLLYLCLDSQSVINTWSMPRAFFQCSCNMFWLWSDFCLQMLLVEMVSCQLPHPLATTFHPLPVKDLTHVF